VQYILLLPWRRIFWLLLARDHNVALGLGQPFLLHLKNCDISPLSDSDFYENENWEHDFKDLVPKQLHCHIHAAIKYVQLATAMEKALLAFPERGESEVIFERSTTLNEIGLQDISMSTTPTSNNFSREDVSSWTDENVCMVFLLLNYERFVTLLHRMDEKVLKASSCGPSNTAMNREDRHSATNTQLERKRALADVRANILSSATRSIRLFEDLLARDLLRYSPSFLTTALFHALLSLVEEILDCEKHMSQYRIAVSRFNMGLEVLGEMRKLYSASTWGYLMFKQLMLNDFSNIKPSRNPGTALDVASPRGFSGFSTDVGSSWYLEGEDCLLDPMQFLADQDLFFPDVLEEGQSLGLK